MSAVHDSINDLPFVSTRWIDRLAYSRDASLYRLIPEAIARPKNESDVELLLSLAVQQDRHVTFRTGGTSLSGQAVSSGIIVDLTRDWHAVEILDQGNKVRTQPGVTGGIVNAYLAPFAKKIGPDPASISAAMIGGIVANNASGMCCGVELNSYHTMDSVRFMLADGYVIDTSIEDCDMQFKNDRPELYRSIEQIRDRVRSDDSLSSTIRRKYRIKNTMGYALNALLDEEEPARILGRLMVGSEGTLGFLSQVTFNTVPDAREKYTQLFVYESLDEACATIPVWTARGAAAVEIMDDASLRSFADLPHTPDRCRVRSPGSCALLVEFHDARPDGDGWSTTAEEREVLWRLRKGLMPTIGAARPKGTTMINEDIAVPPERLAGMIKDVQQSFVEFDYKDAIIFGHAKDGNIHFVIYQDFAKEGETDRYARFMDRISEIIVDKYQGSLKAEHGTGRNMAPYVEKEWGSTAYGLMKEIKSLLDPHLVLNPDVLLASDESIHVKNIKPIPTIESSVDSCIECGFCEPVCPTRTITLTPRQRIVIRRERQLDHASDVIAHLDQEESWESTDSCAADGMCSVACPVDINTADLVKETRSEQLPPAASTLGEIAANNFSMVDAGVRVASALARRVYPKWPRTMGTPTRSVTTRTTKPDVILFPSCPSRWFGASRTDSINSAVLTLCERAGLHVTQPPSKELCCGQIFDSKGLGQGASQALERTMRSIDMLTPGEAVPIVCDVSTCSAALKGSEFGSRIISPGAFMRSLLKHLKVSDPISKIVLHPGCGTVVSRDLAEVRTVLETIADRVIIPANAGCCGMAGDHGLRHPDLADAAMQREVQEINDLDKADHYVSLNPVCQAGLAERTNREWTSVWQVLELATR